MYGQHYGYRSGLNPAMVRHLRHRVRRALQLGQPQKGDVVLDIGSNDGTALRVYPRMGLQLIGMDPTGLRFARYYPEEVTLIPDYFSAGAVKQRFPGRKARIVTAFAMFYDLEEPQAFMEEVHDILSNNGIWVFEQSYLPSMLATNAYDTICHEHLSYYALRQIKWMTDRVGFKILDVEINDVNGGSFCVTLAKKEAPYPANYARVEELLAREEKAGLGTLETYHRFRSHVFTHRNELCAFVNEVAHCGRSIYGYGASTKGNVLLQFCRFTAADLPAIAEINEDKYGAYTPGTLIPIRSEVEVRACNPHYLLVLPWHFRSGIIDREAAYLARGGKLVFPLPRVEVVDRMSARRSA
jgi:hypothetical protein